MYYSAVRPRWTMIQFRYMYCTRFVVYAGFKSYSTLFIVSIFSLLCAKIRRFILFHFIDETSQSVYHFALRQYQIGNTISHKIKVKQFGSQLALKWVTIIEEGLKQKAGQWPLRLFGGPICSIPCRASCFASGVLKEMVEFDRVSN